MRNLVFVPEVFSLPKKEEIAARRMAAMSSFFTAEKGRKKLMLLIGELKDEDGRGRRKWGNKVKLVIKQMPDFPFYIDEKPWQRVEARFENMFQLSKLKDNYHLIIIATFWISETGLAIINEMSLMAVNDNWIPFENLYEDLLLQQLAQLHRKSIKGLRFNLAADRPIVAATFIP